MSAHGFVCKLRSSCADLLSFDRESWEGEALRPKELSVNETSGVRIGEDKIPSEFERFLCIGPKS